MLLRTQLPTRRGQLVGKIARCSAAEVVPCCAALLGERVLGCRRRCRAARSCNTNSNATARHFGSSAQPHLVQKILQRRPPRRIPLGRPQRHHPGAHHNPAERVGRGELRPPLAERRRGGQRTPPPPVVPAPP